MSEKKHLFGDDEDALVTVITKLNAVCDFVEMLGDDFTLRKRTPEGLGMILGECINTLNRIGGFHEQTAG